LRQELHRPGGTVRGAQQAFALRILSHGFDDGAVVFFHGGSLIYCVIVTFDYSIAVKYLRFKGMGL
jgi:hypothetical protein